MPIKTRKYQGEKTKNKVDSYRHNMRNAEISITRMETAQEVIEMKRLCIFVF